MKKHLFAITVFFFSVGLMAQNTIKRLEGSPYPFSTVPDKLYLTSESYNYSQRIAIQSIQGVLAKTKPEILRDVHGHKAVVSKTGIPLDLTYYNNFQGLISKFADRFDGYILCESRQSSTNVALSLSGILNAIAIPADIEQTAIDAGMKMLLDVRGKDELWAMANYGNQFSKTIASYQNCSDDRGLFLGDYSSFAGAFQFWDNSSTGVLATSVYNRMNPGATFFGWGAGEYETVEQLSKKSMLIHPSDFSPNLSTLTNIPVEIPKQKDPINKFKVVPNVHTVCFVMSDGDNVQWLSGASDNIHTWANPDRERLNLGWTISPALVELAPVMYKKYVENCLTTNEGRNYLVAAPSGVGYHFPGIFPDLANECDLLNKFMKKADLNIVNIIDVDNGAHNPDQYLRQSNIDALFYYTYGANYTGMNGKISWYKDKPSIGGRYTLWGTLSSPDALADRLNKSSRSIYSEAGYSLIPVHVWSRNVTDVMDCIKRLNPNVRVVAPDEFVWLIRKNLKGVNLGTGNGLTGSYFKGTSPDSLKYSQIDSKIDFDWGNGSPNEDLIGKDNFSIRWSGQIQAVYTEKYTIYSKLVGGAKLLINGRQIFNSLNSPSATELSDTITLVSGQKYDIELQYNENGGNAMCSLEWESSSQIRQVVPRTQLYTKPLPTTGLITAYADCDYDGFSSALKLGDYRLADITDLGFNDKDIASVKIPNGYKIILFDADNFTGDSIILTNDSVCLSTWSNKASSLKVKTNGLENLEGTYFLKNKAVNFNMEVEGGYLEFSDGANIQQFTRTQNINQQFKFTHLGDGTYSITALSSNKSLDVDGFSMNDGANVQQWSNYNSSNQKFIVVPGSAGSYKIIAAHSGKILEASTFTSGASIRQWYDYNQSKGQWVLTPVPVPENSDGTGLTAKYYNGQDFNALRYTTIDTTINFDWGLSAPYSKTSVDNFSVRWEGEIESRFSGTYTFFVNSDNGRRLWINDQLIIDEWISDYGIEYSGTINLIANRKYPFKLEYFEDAGGAGCKLEWTNNKQPREVVPKSQLFPVNISGFENNYENEDVSIYPNPIKNKILNIQLKGLNNNGKNSLSLFDLVGNQVFSSNLEHSCKIDLNGVPSGVYIVSIKNNIRCIAERILIP